MVEDAGHTSVRMRMTKTGVPVVEAALQRERLFAVLDEGRARGFTWVAGPPGAGKTVLLATYLARSDDDAIWYRCDRADRDLATLVHGLGRAVEAAAPGAVIPRLAPELAPALEAFAAHFWGAVFDALPDPVIVLDDLQELGEDPALHTFLNAALARLPARGWVCAVSRRRPSKAYARLQVSGGLQLLTGQTLAATGAELDALIQLHGGDAAAANTLMERTSGWMAGVALLVHERGGDGLTRSALAPTAHDLVHRYLIGQVLEPLPDRAQQVLLKTAFLSVMSVADAVTVSEIEDAGAVLAELARQQLLVTEYRDRGYRLHPLLSDALQAEAAQRLDDRTLRRVLNASARVYEDAGEIETAFALAARAANWGRAGQLVMMHGPTFLKLGRHGALAQLLDQLPETVSSLPWMRFWDGCAAIPVDAPRAAATLEATFLAFVSARDATGAAASFAALVQSVVVHHSSAWPLRAWWERLLPLLDASPPLPIEVEAHVAGALTLALAALEPRHPALPRWHARTRTLIATTADPDLRFELRLPLLLVGLTMRDFLMMEQDVAALKAHVATGQASAAQTMNYHVFAVLHALHTSPSRCLERSREALAASERVGATFWNEGICQHAAGAALLLDRHDEARDWIARCAPDPAQLPTLDRVGHHWLMARMAALDRDPERSVAHAEAALRDADAFGNWITRHNTLVLLQEVCTNAGRAADAKRYEQLLMDAALGVPGAWATGEDLAVTEVSALTSEARRRWMARFRLTSLPYRTSRAGIRETLREALLQPMEIGIVRSLVAELGVTLGADVAPPPDWPWRLCVHVLGAVEIQVDGGPGKRPRQAPKLLRALVARRRRPWRVPELVDALWPDSDGDKAMQSFRTALHRLRRFLSVPDAVIEAAGTIALNPACCWVDLWAVEDAARPPDDWPPAAVARARERALELVARGDLGGTDPWSLTLQRHFDDAVAQLRPASTACGR